MRKLRSYFVLILIVAAILLAATFAWLNPQSMTLDLGVAVIETPVAYAFIGCLAMGWLLGLLTTLGWVVRLAARSRRERKAAKQAESEARNLRRLTVSDDG